MRRPGGYAVTTGPAGTVETDTFTCSHCNVVVPVPAGKSPSDIGGWWCTLCDKPACAGCNGKRCVPFEKKLEAMERQDRLRRQLLG